MDELIQKRLLLSNEFATTFDCAGNTVLYKFTAPERHVRLSEMSRVFLSCFSPIRRTTVAAAGRRLCTYFGVHPSAPCLNGLSATVKTFMQLGVLVSKKKTLGAYSLDMARYYVVARQVPRDVCRAILKEGEIEHDTRLLDIGTGTGSIAIQLAGVCGNITGLDISEAFLRMAGKIAKTQGRQIRFVREDANKLIFHNAEYNVITASQVLHWIDPQLAVRGICHILRDNGRLFVLESKAVLPSEHPFRRLFGYGCSSHSSVLKECNRHTRQYCEMFEQLRPPSSSLDLAGVWVFRERRRFDMTFARAYFFGDRFRATSPGATLSWSALARLLDNQPAKVIAGYAYWLLLRFDKRRGRKKVPSYRRGIRPSEVIEIAAGMGE
jgi:ubiquinone/menaquinone biosynthesis C-methylase UbiE